MKKLLLLAFSMLTLASCSKDSELIDLESDSKSQIINVKSITNTDDQRAAYLLLDKTEKYILWKDGLETYLNDSVLTPSQTNLIIDLKSHISPDVFSENTNNLQAYFINIYVPQFLTLAQQHFTFEQNEAYFYKIPPFLRFDVFENNPAKKSCNCNQYSIFGCGSTMDCESSNCKVVANACGFLLMFSCDGKCSWL